VRVRPSSLFATGAALLFCVLGGELECEPPRSAIAQARGADVYARMCSVCHGASREGYKADHAPALGQQDFLASVTPEFLTAAISGGRASTTMSAWGVRSGGPLGTADVTALVDFLYSWQESPTAILDESPNRGTAARGEVVFFRECARCHGDRGFGGEYESIGSSQLLSTASDGFLRYAIRRGRPGTPMPGFRATLGDAAIDDVIATLRQWQGAPTQQVQRTRPAKPPPLPLGPVPLNPSGPEPTHLRASPLFTPADAIKGELDRGARMAILDARAPSDYTGNHIRGAVSVPFYDPDPYIDQLPKDTWLVCYCGCPHAESGQLAHKLQVKGFTKVAVLDEGLNYWIRKNYETAQGVGP
jgi:cytochrome c oxidase cbb3-type subunit 3/ubiquinol-cytochrome c reductase cytochrome c subunit